MFEWISTLTGGQVVGLSGIALIISGFILKTTGLLKNLRSWFGVTRKWMGKVGYNTGVIVTTKGNSIPVLGLFYEYLIEPAIVLVSELIPGLIFEFFNMFVNGLKSDNKELKTKKNPEGK